MNEYLKLPDVDKALHCACQKVNTETIRQLLNDGANPNKPDHNRWVALHWVSSMDYEECVQLMAYNNSEENSIVYSDISSLDGVQLLLQNGANPNIRNNKGDTPLHQSSINRTTDKCRLLLDYGANPNIQNNDGSTILHLVVHNPLLYAEMNKALKASRLDFVRLLIGSGSNLDIQDNDGQTVLHLAVCKSEIEIIRLLLSSKINCNIQNNRGESALYLATKNGNNEIAELLLSHGCNPNIKNNNGETVLQLAITNLNEEIVHLLLKNNAHPVNPKYGIWRSFWLNDNELRQLDLITKIIQNKQRERICKGIEQLRSLRLHYLILRLWQNYWYEEFDEKGCNRHFKHLSKIAIQNGWVTI